MDYLSSILPPPDEGGEGPSVSPRTYFAVGISPDGKVRTAPCPDRETLRRRCAEWSGMGWSAYFANALYGPAQMGRRQSNVVGLRAFWLDVDVGKKANSYPDRDAALAGVADFVGKFGVEPTHLVSSGMGLYVYWCLDRTISPQEWRPLARSLGAACAKAGFIVDPACTCDPARILRMPGTLHPKSGNVVTVLASGEATDRETFELSLRNLGMEAPASAPVRASLEASSVFASAPVYRAEPIVANCRQMREAGTGTEPCWYAMMSVLKRCADGREWAHALSERDPRYVPSDTDAKFDHAPADSPATCERFASLAPWCAGCPWRGTLKSPAELYRRAGAAPPADVAEDDHVPDPESVPDPEIPRLKLTKSFRHDPVSLDTASFSVTKSGVVWHETVKTASGDYERVDHVVSLSRPYYLYSTFKSGEDGDYSWTHWFRAYGPKGDRLSPRKGFGRDEIASASAAYAKFTDMLVYSTDLRQYGAALFQRFYNTYMQTLVSGNLIRRVDSVGCFGWKETEDGPAFSVGPGLVDAEGFRQQEYYGAAGKMAKAMGFAGSLAEWKKIPAMYEELWQPEAMLAMCLGFASILMPFAPGTAHSAIFSMWSAESGLGKTQMLRAVATIWGDPDRQFIENSTSRAAIMRHLACLRNVPAYLDELTEKPDDDLYSLSYALASGQEKKKMTRAGDDLVDTGSWNNVTFCTANKSIKEAVSHASGNSVAAVARIIECECKWRSYADDPAVQSEIKDRIALCKRHYGLAGPEFAYQVILHADRLDVLPDVVDAWVTKRCFSNEERFLSTPLALAMKAGRWAVEWGLLDYDMDRLEEWATDTFGPLNRRDTSRFRTEAHEIMHDYLMARQRNWLVVKQDARQGRPPSPAALDPYVVSAPVNADIVGRLALAEGRLYFSANDFDSWCRRNRYSSANVLSQLRASGYDAYKKLRNLASGTSRYHLPQVTCVVLDSQDLAKLGYSWEAPAKTGEGSGN